MVCVRPLLIPVTVTVYVPADPEHESTLVPPDTPMGMLVGDRVQVSPLEGTTELVKSTVPVNPPSGCTEIVEVPATPASTVNEDGLAFNVKSWTVNLTVTLCSSEPGLSPIMRTSYWIARVVGPLKQVRVLVPEPPAMLVDDRSQDRFPVGGGGLTSIRNVTVPVNPFTGEMVIVEVPGELAITVTVAGVAVIVKSTRAVTV